MNWKHQTKIGAFLIMLLYMLHYFGASAFAEFGFAPPPATDMSRSFLNQIFGGLLDGGVDAFGGSILSFNGAILVVGGILAAYTIFAGTLGTAHDGEVLGRKFSSVWIPIRYALGTALVLPVLSGGYCIMQSIVMWLIMQGVSLANGVWTEFMTNPPSLSLKKAATPSPALVKLVEDVYLLNLCVHSNQVLREQGAGGSFLNWFASSSSKWEKREIPKYNENNVKVGIRGYRYGLNSIISSTGCGKVFYADGALENSNWNTNTEVNGNFSDITKTNTYIIPSLGGIEKAFEPPDYTSIVKAHNTNLNFIMSETEKVVIENISKYETPLEDPAVEYKKIYDIAVKYNTKILEAAKAITETHSIKDASTAHGWFIAGAWATQVIVQQNKLNGAINSLGTVEDLRFGTDTDAKLEDFTKISKRALSVISTSNATARQFLDANHKPQGKAGKKEAKSEDKTIGGSVAGYLAYFVTGIDLEEIKNDSRHPLIVMATIGNSILNSVLIALTIIFGVSMAGVLLPGWAAPMVAFFGAMAIPIAGFMGIAATLAFLLPNLPFLLWVGCIIGWTVMCVEAILAAPLWAVMHLHPDGSDLTGRGGNGYMLVLGLLLRPGLIVFGLIAAISLSGLFGQFVNAIFMNVFLLNQADSSMGFFAVLFGTALYATLMMTVIQQTFQLIHVIPDQLLRWIGGGGEQLGQYAGASAGSMAKATTAAGAVAGLAAQNIAQSAGAIAGTLGAKKRERDAMEDKKLADASNAETELGAGAGAAFGSIDSSAGSTQNATSQKAELTNAIKSIGGGEAGLDLLKSFNSPQNPGTNFSEKLSNAKNDALSENMGPGAAKLGQLLSSGQAGSWGNSNDSARALGSVRELFQNAGKNADGTFDAQKGAQAVSDVANTVSGNLSKQATSSSGQGSPLETARKEFNDAKNGFFSSQGNQSPQGMAGLSGTATATPAAGTVSNATVSNNAVTPPTSKDQDSD